MGSAEPVSKHPENWLTYQRLLDSDTRAVPRVLRCENPLQLPPSEIPVERYTSREFFDLEVERLWKRVWQMACREEDIPNIGDNIVYDIVSPAGFPIGVSPSGWGHPACSAAATAIAAGLPAIP